MTKCCHVHSDQKKKKKKCFETCDLSEDRVEKRKRLFFVFVGLLLPLSLPFVPLSAEAAEAEL